MAMLARVRTLPHFISKMVTLKQQADIHTYCTYWLELAWDGGGGTLRRVCKSPAQFLLSINGCACGPLAPIMLFSAQPHALRLPLLSRHLMNFALLSFSIPPLPALFMAVALLIQTWRAADAEKCLYPRGGLYVHTIKINHFFLPPRIGALCLMQQCCSHTSEGGCVLF